MRSRNNRVIDWLLTRIGASFLFWVLILSTLPSCAAIGHGLKYMGERMIQLGGATAAGALAWILYPVGLAGVALAAGTAAVVSALLAPRPVVDQNGQPVGDSGLPWGYMLGAIGGFALMRAWVHYPEMGKAMWAAVQAAGRTGKVAARGVLGGIQKKRQSEDSIEAP